MEPSLAPIQESHNTANISTGFPECLQNFRAHIATHPAWPANPDGQVSSARGSRAWYLLVQEQIPSQEAFLSAQQDPVSTLGFSPAAGLRHLVTVQSQESEH